MSKVLHVKKRNGRLENLNINKINLCVERACSGLENVSVSEIILDAHVQLYDKIPTAEIDKALIMSARTKIEKEPNYAHAASRLLLATILKEVFGENCDRDAFEHQYKSSFIKSIKMLVKEEVINPKLLEFDLKKISDAIKPDRDLKFKYLGLQIVYDRYLLHLKGRRLETPQGFWMRVAMGLALNEQNKEEKAIQFYDAFSQFLLCPSTPTLFNSGTMHSQLSSCYLNTFDDSIDGIFEGLWQEARKSKFAGGLGFDVTNFRAANAYVKGTNGKSSGLIPWLKIYNDTLIAVDQGGKRPGAGCAYLETWHLDLEDFLDLKKNTGDERRRCHDMNTANWIPDLFMRRIQEDGDWYLFSPSDVRDLHETYGEDFDNRYLGYCKKAEAGELLNFRKVKAKELWKKMLRVLFETGHPWITFKDNANLRYSNSHEGTVHSSNLCLTGDTQIYALVDKMPTHISLRELNDLFSLSKDMKVLSYNEKEQAYEYKSILASALTKKNADLIKITDSQTGKSIKCTPEHKVFTKNRGYIQAKDLAPMDELEILDN
jgi:ribonucleoside-diphosphate reductase alpha chain